VFANFYYDVATSTFCFALGHQIQPILFTILNSNSFKDCYKNIIKSLCDLTNWTAEDALWIETCTDSISESITVYTWNPIASIWTTFYYGTFPGVNVGCIPGVIFKNSYKKYALDSIHYYLLTMEQNMNKTGSGNSTMEGSISTSLL
jgi:hypothetical protein